MIWYTFLTLDTSFYCQACDWRLSPHARSSEDLLQALCMLPLREQHPTFLWRFFCGLFGLYIVPPIAYNTSSLAEDSGEPSGSTQILFCLVFCCSPWVLLGLSKQSPSPFFNSWGRAQFSWVPSFLFCGLETLLDLLIWVTCLFLISPELIVLLRQLSSSWQLFFHDILPSFFLIVWDEELNLVPVILPFALEHIFCGLFILSLPSLTSLTWRSASNATSGPSGACYLPILSVYLDSNFLKTRILPLLIS